jgi:superfamily I DNA/RNA helicase
MTYRLVRRPPTGPVALDRAQRAVAEHRHGALLVLGGPRTGKTTALVEAAAGWPGPVTFVAGSRRWRLQVRADLARRCPQGAERMRVETWYSLSEALVRRFGGADQPLEVLSATRQDAYIRQILLGQPAAAWPRRYQAARGTQGFADAVREAVAACGRAGLEPADLAALGRWSERDEVVALARFWQEYLDILGMAQVVDYTDLLVRAARLLDQVEARDWAGPPGALVLVDDAEDLDPAQAAVLAGLTDRTTTVIVAANPDEQVFGFRGADPRSIAQLGHAWAQAGLPQATIALQQGYGVADAVEAAWAGWKRRIPLPAGVDTAQLEAYRDLRPRLGGQAVKWLFQDATLEADHIARWLRDRHQGQGCPWQEMAIVVRHRQDFARYVGACQRWGVPVAVSGDEIELKREPVAAGLVAALQVVALGLGAPAPQWRTVLGLGWAGQQPTPGAAPATVLASDTGLGQVLQAGRSALAGAVADVLWAVWQASGWQEELLGEIARPGRAGLRAQRDVDAAQALFALAEQ